MKPSHYSSPHGIRIAYHYTPGKTERVGLPGVVFLGGFRSNMNGIKARYLEQICKRHGQAYLRFDYSGHGCSSGTFEDGTIGSWAQDATDIIDHIFGQHAVILVGSSMGGWIALRLLLNRTVPIRGIIGIAAAPDFTRDIWHRMSRQDRKILARNGYLEIPSDYTQEPYRISRTLLEDGEQQSVLSKTCTIQVPLVLIHGKQDTDISWKKADDTASVFNGPGTRVILVESGDHRLSEPENLRLIENELTTLSNLDISKDQCRTE